MRAGENILIADLPKTEVFSQGRDGETLFHIVGVQTDTDAGLVTLELEGRRDGSTCCSPASPPSRA
jgi:hypothetical protein